MRRHRLLHFGRDRSGIAIVEFALVVPFLILLAATGFDVVRYILFTRKIELAVSTMADLLARNDTGKVNQSDLLSVSRAQLVIFPEAMKVARDKGVPVWSILKWTLSGVSFKAPASCGSSCTYTPYVAWTSGQRRPCSVPLTSMPNTAPPNPSRLPSDTFGPSFLIVADVVFSYTPVIAQSVIGSINITKSFYMTPRYVSTIAFDSSAGTSSAVACVIP